MDHPSTTDRISSGDVSSATSPVLSFPAGAASHYDKPEPRFPGEDGGMSLAVVAEGDLDAALQLLAARAQHVTQASGAAIALRHGNNTDMICRTSAGTNVPQPGATLSTEQGLSGECVRTGKTLCCGDAAHDSRVDREACRHLGIASVAIAPVIADGTVRGVFELFSTEPKAFTEGDLSALRRLSEMVGWLVANPVIHSTQKASARNRPLFWAAKHSEHAAGTIEHSGPESIPPILRNLQKCEACGFPVSQGRTLCVECEEKNWRE
jgi:GAF domain